MLGVIFIYKNCPVLLQLISYCMIYKQK